MRQRNRPAKRPLTAVAVKYIKAPGRYWDGNGLYLVVDESGARRWLLRIYVQGRRRDIGLGSARLVPLVTARDIAIEMRRVARDGGDPLAERRKRRRIAPTFKEAATQVHSETVASWKNARHSASWLSSLEAYAFPVFGNRPIDQIATSDVLKVLLPIWLTKSETARRVRQRLRTVFDWSRVAYSLNCANPVDGVERALPKQSDRKQHLAALPYAEVPSFMTRLRQRSPAEPTILAFEFLVLTACRTSEVLLAAWDEIDFEAAIWTIPAMRMKANELHVVPLCPRALQILAAAKKLAGKDPLVFVSRAREQPLSNMVFLMTLRRMELAVTAHGFRSSFRDWAAEETDFPNFVVEKALAHAIDNKVEAAYRRGDLLKKRRELMDAWSAFCAGTTKSPKSRSTDLDLKTQLDGGHAHDRDADLTDE